MSASKTFLRSLFVDTALRYMYLTNMPGRDAAGASLGMPIDRSSSKAAPPRRLGCRPALQASISKLLQ
jgi:hypothetical protein